MDIAELTPTGGLPKVNADGCSAGVIRRFASDFKVTEELPFEPKGEGEHLLLQFKKVNKTTNDIQSRIAHRLRIRHAEIGYMGMKDKRSEAIQWFSVQEKHVRRKSDLEKLGALQCVKHDKKLRRSDGCRNHFEIKVRDIELEKFDPNHLRSVPNYFGGQRFGRDRQNVTHALRWINEKREISKFLRGIYISALRSWLFNHVLAERVRQKNWNLLLPGDTETDFPSGPLWGRGLLKTTELTRELEESILAEIRPVTEQLELVGLYQARRSLVLEPINLKTEVEEGVAHISFTLTGGGYATSVLREAFSS